MSPVVLPCHVQGRPQPTVTWTKGGAKLGARGGTYRVLPTGKTSCLKTILYIMVYLNSKATGQGIYIFPIKCDIKICGFVLHSMQECWRSLVLCQAMLAGTHAQLATQLEWLTNTSLSLCKVDCHRLAACCCVIITCWNTYSKTCKHETICSHVFLRAPRDHANGRGSTGGVASWGRSSL